MASPTFGGKTAHTLDFDIECRPLSWYGGDFVTREITAIAARFVPTDEHIGRPMYVWALGIDDPQLMLQTFRDLYSHADVVTGHFIRGFDLPNLNAAYMEYGMAPLTEKWSVDTKLDLVKRSGMSASQENLAAMLHLEHPKVQMTQADWREANRLTSKGIKKTIERVTGDVNQHIEMLAALRAHKMVGPGKLWTPQGKGKGGYTP